MRDWSVGAFWASSALLAAFVIAVFANTATIPLNAEDLQVYVNYIYFTGDDLLPEAFYGNGFGILPGEFVHKLGRKPEEIGGVYRPLTALLMAFDFAVCRTESLCYHITNLVLQIACSIAVLALAHHISRGNLLVSISAALLFSVNPTHSLTQVVMLQRSDILCTLFYVLSVLFFARYADRPDDGSRRDYILSAVFMLLAFMSKEMAVTLPITLVLYDLFVVRSDRLLSVAGAKRLIRRHALFWGMLAAYIAFRMLAFGGVGGYPGFAFAFGEEEVEKPAALVLGRHNITNAISGLNHLFGVSSFSRLVRYALLGVIFGPLLFPTDRRIKLSIALTLVCMLPVLTQTSITSLYMYLSSVWFSIGIVASLSWLVLRFLRGPAGKALVCALVIAGIVVFTEQVHANIAIFRPRIEFAYRTAERVSQLVKPMPKGAKLLLVTHSMLESSGRIDFDPAIEAVLRLKAKDLSLKLWPIPLNIEKDVMMELLDAAVLDMEKIEVGDRTYFFDNLSGELRIRPDLRQRFLSRAARRAVKGSQPGDHCAWAVEEALSTWSVVDETGSPLSTELTDDHLEFASSGSPVSIVSPELAIDTTRPDRFAFRMSIEGDAGPNELLASVQWTSKNYPNWTTEQSRTVNIRCDGGSHTYTVEPGKDFHWVTAESVNRIRIQLPPLSARVCLSEVVLYKAQELN